MKPNPAFIIYLYIKEWSGKPPPPDELKNLVDITKLQNLPIDFPI